MKVDEYKKQAVLNSTKTAAELKVDDFIFTSTAAGKDTNFTDFVDARVNWNMGTSSRLCKVVDIIDVPEDYDFLNGWLDKEALSHRGGSQSDDIDESRNPFQLTKADYETFFDLITVIRKPSCKWIGVDCQGYDYWRYVHLPNNYSELFAEEKSDALRKLAERDAERLAEKMKELEEHAKALQDRENELRGKYFGLVLNPANSRLVGNNIRKFLAIEFPEIKFKVSVRRSYWGDNNDVSVYVIGVNDEEKRNEIREVCKVWTETMPTGRMTDSHHYCGETETKMCPMQIFGRVNGRFSFNFE